MTLFYDMPGWFQIWELMQKQTAETHDGYQENVITGTPCVDINAAYDTVNYSLIIQKHNTRQRTM